MSARGMMAKLDRLPICEEITIVTSVTASLLHGIAPRAKPRAAARAAASALSAFARSTPIGPRDDGPYALSHGFFASSSAPSLNRNPAAPAPISGAMMKSHNCAESRSRHGQL
jgi:hypothetical protein